MTRALALVAMVVLAAVVALVALVGSGGRVAAADDAADFAPIARVLLSPRCKNCHPAGDAPLVGDASARHRMNVSRASPEAGLPCTTCHRGQNADRAHGPPGVPNWRMPSAERPLVFEGRTPRELCLQLKDVKKNGGKSLPALEQHFASDPLVLWGYAPGPERTLPPLAHDALVLAVHRWIAAGAPCPP